MPQAASAEGATKPPNKAQQQKKQQKQQKQQQQKKHKQQTQQKQNPTAQAEASKEPKLTRKGAVDLRTLTGVQRMVVRAGFQPLNEPAAASQGGKTSGRPKKGSLQDVHFEVPDAGQCKVNHGVFDNWEAAKKFIKNTPPDNCRYNRKHGYNDRVPADMQVLFGDGSTAVVQKKAGYNAVYKCISHAVDRVRLCMLCHKCALCAWALSVLFADSRPHVQCVPEIDPGGGGQILCLANHQTPQPQHPCTS